MSETERLVTSAEAAELCGVSRNTIKQWVFRKQLAPSGVTDRRQARGYLYREEDVLACDQARRASLARKVEIN